MAEGQLIVLTLWVRVRVMINVKAYCVLMQFVYAVERWGGVRIEVAFHRLFVYFCLIAYGLPFILVYEFRMVVFQFIGIWGGGGIDVGSLAPWMFVSGVSFTYTLPRLFLSKQGLFLALRVCA